uniref:Uncharacterized protein n=1 Tax=Rangifer tarandus platyrhynchus TaxID=3082113 RepID=A0ACB0EKN1_RANTA|nr:unnamed protein product [Rangifer tarandus platyrhynchus]
MSGPALPQPREMCTAQLERRVTEALESRESHGGQTEGGVETSSPRGQKAMAIVHLIMSPDEIDKPLQEIGVNLGNSQQFYNP